MLGQCSIVIKIFKETFNFFVDRAVHRAILWGLVTPSMVNKPKHLHYFGAG